MGNHIRICLASGEAWKRAHCSGAYFVASVLGHIPVYRFKRPRRRGPVSRTCLTGFGIFQHGGFGKPHVLGIITLVVLGVAALAGYSKMFGRASAYAETVSYSATFFFHMIPGTTETTTRLPPGAPLLPNADAPALQAATGVLFVVFLIGAAMQARVLRARRAGTP